MKNYELIETRRIDELSTDACIYQIGRAHV